MDHEFFFSKARELKSWNEILHSTYSDDGLSQFCSRLDPLSFIRMMQGLDGAEHDVKTARAVVDRLHLFQARILESGQPLHNHLSFEDMLMVWDTGASYGLTPFREDIINYKPCSIPAKDISEMNYVVGVGL